MSNLKKFGKYNGALALSCLGLTKKKEKKKEMDGLAFHKRDELEGNLGILVILTIEVHVCKFFFSIKHD